MNGYGLGYRGHSTYGNGGEQKTDDWNKPSYASNHVGRPVITGADGKKRPIVSYAPGNKTEYYIIQAETVVERVYSPLAGEYRHSSPTKVEPFKSYLVNEEKWHTSSCPVSAHERMYSPLASDYRQNSPTKVEPFKDYQVNEEKWHNSLSPVHVNRSQKVDDFLTKVQNEASRPKFSSLGWRQTPASGGGYNGDHHQNHKPTDNTGYDDHYQNKDTKMKPAMLTTDGWSRPNRALWASPPNSTLSEPTNDIGTAIEYLKEATRPYSTTNPTSLYAEPVSRGPKPAVYAEAIDNLGAAKQYSNYKLPVEQAGNYAGTIDSKEAARKYGGRIV